MKKIMRSGIILTALFYSMNNYANKVECNFKKAELVKEKQNLLITNANGVVLYKETINPFSSLSSGIIFYKGKETTKFKPIVKIKNNSVFISALSLDLEAVSVELYYDLSDNNSGNYELIYKEKFENQMSISRIYRLDDKKKGDYKVVFKINGKTFIEKVEI